MISTREARWYGAPPPPADTTWQKIPGSMSQYRCLENGREEVRHGGFVWSHAPLPITVAKRWYPESGHAR